MKICLTINSSPWSTFKGGGQLAVHHLACALFSKGHQVHVLYSKYPHEQFNIDVPYKIHWVNHHDFATVNLNIFSFSRVLGPLAEKEKFDEDHNPWLKFSLTFSTLLILLYFIFPSQIVEVVSRINII